MKFLFLVSLGELDLFQTPILVGIGLAIFVYGLRLFIIKKGAHKTAPNQNQKKIFRLPGAFQKFSDGIPLLKKRA